MDAFSYCWCGHLRDGHQGPALRKGPIKCFGRQPPNDDEACQREKFVPVEVAAFRINDMIMKHVLDFKMLVAAAMAAEGEKRIVDPGRVH